MTCNAGSGVVGQCLYTLEVIGRDSRESSLLPFLRELSFNHR